MGRKPIGKRAMTDAERQRRRRKKVRKANLQLGAKALRDKKRLQAAEEYIPTPPGITYWRKVKIQTVAGEGEIWQPDTRPLAAMKWCELTDDDLNSLAEHLEREMMRRKAERGSGAPAGGFTSSASSAASSVRSVRRVRSCLPPRT